MKVLELFGEPISHGGEEAFVINMLEHIDRSNLQIDFLTPYYCDNPFYQNIVEKAGGKVIALNLPFNPGGLRTSIIKPVNQFLKGNEYDVVHIHSGSISILALGSAVAKHNHIKRIIVHSHCAAEKKTIKHRLVKLFSSPFMFHCPTDYCACSQAAGECKFSRRIAKNKLIVLKNGVDLDQYSYHINRRQEIREGLHISPEEFVVGHVGRFSYQKNQEFLISIFDEFKKIRKDSKLMLIGTGDDMDKIKKQVEVLDLSEDVLFLGTVNDVFNYMQAMDVLAFPSRFEGLPIVAVEAQAAGLPVIASDAVTGSVKLTDAVEFLSLNMEPKLWADRISQLATLQRKSDTESIRKHRYDIKQTAGEVRALYTRA